MFMWMIILEIFLFLLILRLENMDLHHQLHAMSHAFEPFESLMYPIVFSDDHLP